MPPLRRPRRRGLLAVAVGCWFAFTWASAAAALSAGEIRAQARQIGGATGDGISPPTVCSSRGRTVGSGTGIELSKAALYGWAGRAYNSSGGATSHSLPRYITATRSLTFFTTARSWAMNTNVRP